MYKKKIYGQSQNTNCAFCSKQAVTQTEEKIPSCKEHINRSIGVITCVCGNILDVKHSKYGPFFTCVKCGVLSFSKGMSLKNDGKSLGFKLNKKYRTNNKYGINNILNNNTSNNDILNNNTINNSVSNNFKSKKSIKDLWKEHYGL